MKKLAIIFCVSVFIISGITSCKSKQKAVEISGSKIEAKQTNDAKANTSSTSASTNIADVTPVNENTRNEKFSLAEGETNTAAFSSKYHVVVGSFTKKDNAKSLQSTLMKEGNNAFVVINEKGMYRVVISSFDEYYQAKNRINEISNRFPDAWVLVQK